MRIDVVDDHHLFRAGVRAELTRTTTSSARRPRPPRRSLIAETQPDVVLLDVHLPEGGGVAVALSVSDAAEDVVPMIRAVRARRHEVSHWAATHGVINDERPRSGEDGAA